MKHYFRLLTTAVTLLFSVLSEAQESKLRLREFAPKYKVDTFYLQAQGVSKKRIQLKKPRLMPIRGMLPPFEIKWRRPLCGKSKKTNGITVVKYSPS